MQSERAGLCKEVPCRSCCRLQPENLPGRLPGCSSCGRPVTKLFTVVWAILSERKVVPPPSRARRRRRLRPQACSLGLTPPASMRVVWLTKRSMRPAAEGADRRDRAPAAQSGRLFPPSRMYFHRPSGCRAQTVRYLLGFWRAMEPSELRIVKTAVPTLQPRSPLEVERAEVRPGELGLQLGGAEAALGGQRVGVHRLANGDQEAVAEGADEQLAHEVGEVARLGTRRPQLERLMGRASAMAKMGGVKASHSHMLAIV